MAMWELALLLFGVSYLLVNTVSVIYMISLMKTMNKFSGIVDKSVKFTEKMVDAALESLEEENE